MDKIEEVFERVGERITHLQRQINPDKLAYDFLKLLRASKRVVKSDNNDDIYEAIQELNKVLEEIK